jgi:hypothetical protein
MKKQSFFNKYTTTYSLYVVNNFKQEKIQLIIINQTTSQTTMKTYEKAKLSLISIQQPMRSMWLIILNKKKFNQ